MVKLVGQFCYSTQENWTHKYVPYQNDGEDQSLHEAASTSSCSCTSLSSIRQLLSVSSSEPPPLPTEVDRLTSSTCDDDDDKSLCHLSTSSTSYHTRLSDVRQGSHHDQHLAHDQLATTPCTCSAAAELAQGMDACMQQLLHNPSLQEYRTWRMFSSAVHPNPFGSGMQLAQCFGTTCRGGSGKDITEVVIHGSMVFTAHKDHDIRVWKIASRANSASTCKKLKLLCTLPTVKDRFLNCFCDRNYVQVRRHHRCLWIKHADNISALAVGGGCACAGKRQESDVDAELLYSASWDKTFKVWRLSDHKCMESVVAHTDAITAIAIVRCSYKGAKAHQPELLYTASCDGTVKAWTREVRRTRCKSFPTKSNMKIRHRLVATLPNHKCAVNALAVSRDGGILFSAGSDGMIRVWRRSIHVTEHAGSTNTSLRHHDPAGAANMTLCSIVEGHKRAVLCLSIAGDDRVLLSGSADKTVRAWCIERLKGKVSYISDVQGITSCCLTVLKGHSAPIRSVLCGWPCVHGSGYTIFTGAMDTSIKMWWLQARKS